MNSEELTRLFNEAEGFEVTITNTLKPLPPLTYQNATLELGGNTISLTGNEVEKFKIPEPEMTCTITKSNKWWTGKWWKPWTWFCKKYHKEVMDEFEFTGRRLRRTVEK